MVEQECRKMADDAKMHADHDHLADVAMPTQGDPGDDDDDNPSDDDDSKKIE
jgi:hypothetical protein